MAVAGDCAAQHPNLRFSTGKRALTQFRAGGEWDFAMHGPDGTNDKEWISWIEIVPAERIALLHGESRGDPNAFESVITFVPVELQAWVLPLRFFRENLKARRRRRAGVAGGSAIPYVGLRRDAREA